MARVLGRIFVANEAEPVRGDFDHVLQVAVNACHLFFHVGDKLVGFVFIELKDASHLNLHETQYVVACHLTIELGLEGV